MILQEIIRNIVLYNGLVEPWLRLVKETIFSQNDGILPFEANSLNKISLFPRIALTGTHTITEKNVVLSSYFEREIPHVTKISASTGNTFVSLLVTESIVELGRSNFSMNTSNINFLNDSHSVLSTITTGFFIENTQLFFSHETHEKREYLGEFSLPHEEILLNSFIERR
jgi:hypothetical protein